MPLEKNGPRCAVHPSYRRGPAVYEKRVARSGGGGGEASGPPSAAEKRYNTSAGLSLKLGSSFVVPF